MSTVDDEAGYLFVATMLYCHERINNLSDITISQKIGTCYMRCTGMDGTATMPLSLRQVKLT